MTEVALTQNLKELYKIAPLYQELFLQQLQFVLSPTRYVAALCSRRAGKTTVCAIKAFQELINHPGSMGMYLALTDKSVENIFLPTITGLIKKYKLKIKVTGDEIQFSNGSKLLLCGANHPHKVETFRGVKLLFCIIDEAASFSERILHYLIDEIIGPALSDLQGQLMLIGTPAAHCSGTFYEVTKTSVQNDVWVVHKWTALDNPHMRVQELADSELFFKRKNCDANHPKYRREHLGEWCADDDSLMIHSFAVRQPPEPYNQDGWRTCIGVDFGYNDYTTFSVIGWMYNNPKAYVLECFGINKDSPEIKDIGFVSAIANQLLRLKDKYRPVSIVGDPAGASKIMMDEFSKRYHIHLKAAEKTNKAHYIEILDDALINEDLILLPNTTVELQKEFRQVVWNEDRTREQEGKPCDHFDATLYGYREARAYLEKITVVVPPNPNKWADDMLEQAKRNYQMREDAKLGDPFFVKIRKFLGDN